MEKDKRIEHECRYIKHAPQQDVCVLLEGKDNIEVIILNDMDDNRFHRFLIAEGVRWNYAEESLFDELVQNEHVAWSPFHLTSIYEKFSSQHPEWHLRQYMNKPLRVMDHIYHCMHRNSVKEILYKAGLDEIAACIGLVDAYSFFGSSPTEILGGLSIRLLKSLNLPEGMELLKEQWKW